MNCDNPGVTRTFGRRLAGAVVGLTTLGTVWGGVADAEPAHDTLTRLNELSHEAEQLAGSMESAQVDLDRKLQAQRDAEARHTEALAALDAAKSQLAGHQVAVDGVAAAVYMGGRTDGLTAILTAASPKNLIDDLAVQRALTTEMTQRWQNFHRAEQEARRIEVVAARSAADAGTAADQAAALRDDLQHQRSMLRTQVALVRASYAMLPHEQQAGLAASSSTVAAALGMMPPIPLVGMGGLVPNARALVQYIATAYPGVQSIGGVRADPIPDHPSGRAIDVMIGSDMGLGDAINADIQARAGEFGVSYTMWRVANHFNHVHITVF